MHDGQDSINKLLVHAHYAWVKVSRVQIWCGQVVKTDFGQSRILTLVAAICTAPIYVTWPPLHGQTISRGLTNQRPLNMLLSTIASKLLHARVQAQQDRMDA